MNPTLSRRLTKILETRYDKEHLLAIENLSTFYGENNLEARRNLRGQIEKKSIETNQSFLQVLLQVQKHLDEVEENVNQMKHCCTEMNSKLNTTRDLSGRLLQQAEQLNQQRKKNEIQQEIAIQFLKRFQLSEEEEESLKKVEVDADFFKVLDRVSQIHNDCKLLLRTQHQKAGLEMMDMMIMIQETAYGKLYKWVRGECNRFQDSLTPDIPPMLKDAIQALKDRPGLLNHCLDSIATSRSKTIVHGFLQALTVGQGGSRAIELFAHDPLRYVGDMLAWIHQSTASEAEFIHSLVSSSSSSQFSDGKSTQHDARRVLNSILEGVFRPFRVRLSQVLSDLPNSVLLFKLSNLLDFYSRTIVKLTGEKETVSSALLECKTETLKVFYSSLKDYGEKLQRNPPPPPSTLVPPHQFYEAINQMVSLFYSNLNTHISQYFKYSSLKLVSYLSHP
eukprot:TRINITY_DN4730_c0_g1_i3.p1 TRINITY_DN4730_c0_g1~~TRINITY_DN4730_c0_g1_i3.p1  ORF type:complete len:449 (-),score=139.98 TRINITY_DN4730_c0_g1_i3:727-2073(-)